MTIATMRLIDRYAGVPLCWLLGVLRWFRRARRSSPSGHDEIHRILVMKFFGMGSIMLSSPALRLLKISFPGASVAYISFEGNGDQLRRLPDIDEVLLIRTASLWALLADTLKTVIYLRKNRFDAAFDFEFFSKFSTLLGSLSGARVRSGFRLPTLWRSIHLTHAVDLSKAGHVSKAFCSQIFQLVPEVPVPPPSRPGIREEDRRCIERILPGDPDRYVCLHVNAGTTFLERRWPAGRFSELANSLIASDPNTTLVFTGDSGERAYVSSIIARTQMPDRCMNLAGETTFGELAALLERCSLLVSCDSGPLHVASVLGTPCIALYGPESPAFYGPLGPAVTVLYAGISCSPCMNVYDAKTFRCPYRAKCMDEITPVMVLDAIGSMRIPA